MFISREMLRCMHIKSQRRYDLEVKLRLPESAHRACDVLQSELQAPIAA